MAFRWLLVWLIALSFSANSANATNQCREIFSSFELETFSSVDSWPHGHGSVRFNRVPGRPNSVHAYNIMTNNPVYAANVLGRVFKIWFVAGAQKIIEISLRLGGNVSLEQVGSGRIVFGIDVPRSEIDGTVVRRTIFRVPQLLGQKFNYEYPRIEMYVEPAEHEMRIALIAGRANGQRDDHAVIVDDNVSHSVGVQIRVPTDRQGFVLIRGPSIKMATMLAKVGTEQIGTISLLDMAVEISNSFAPGREIQLLAREGFFVRRPGDFRWHSAK